MKVLVTGYSGQLGFDVVRELLTRGFKKEDILTPSSKEMNLTDEESVHNVVNNFKPDVIIHCAAWTKVDLAEDEKEACLNVNGLGTKYLVEAASTVDSSIIVISSDYVFDGKKDGIYNVNDVRNPQNVYGESKVLTENYALTYGKSFVVRTSWVFGINGGNFVKTMLKLSETKNELSVVSDQVGSPTYTVDLAKFLVDLSLTNQYGIYHATNEGFCSWAEFAKYIFETNGKKVLVKDIPTKEYSQKAVRPLNSRLNKDCITDIGLEKLPTWQDAIQRYNKELKMEMIKK
jgi:dTDP-4-dehydrorhamnose reductase